MFSAIPAQAMEGMYKPYDKTSYEQSAEGKRVLFFHAKWCPACVSADKALSMSGAVPEGVTVFKVDYDMSADLKKQYGVTMQHTFVQVDAFAPPTSIRLNPSIKAIML